MTGSFWRWWAPLLGYMTFVFWMSSRARPEVLSEAPDYVLHAGAYFVMALLAVRAFAKGLLEGASGAALSRGVVLAILYGVTDEWHQAYVPGRVASFGDLIADALGALGGGAAIGLFWIWTVRFKSTKGEKSGD